MGVQLLNLVKLRKRKKSLPILTMKKIKERGYVTVSIDNNSTGYFIYRGQTMGFEYELLKRFTDKHGLELRIDVLKQSGRRIQQAQSGGKLIFWPIT